MAVELLMDLDCHSWGKMASQLDSALSSYGMPRACLTVASHVRFSQGSCHHNELRLLLVWPCRCKQHPSRHCQRP